MKGRGQELWKSWRNPLLLEKNTQRTSPILLCVPGGHINASTSTCLQTRFHGSQGQNRRYINNSLSLVSTGCRIHSTLNRHSRHSTLNRNARLIHNSFSWSQDQISLSKNLGRRSQKGRAIRDSARGYFGLVATISVQSPVFSARWKQCWREDEPGKY